MAIVLYIIKIHINPMAKKTKPQLSKKEELFLDLLVSIYSSGIINESVNEITKRLEEYQYKRATVHRYIRKLYYCGFLAECGKVGKTGRIIIYQIKS